MQMDIHKLIQELHAEREALDRAISSLEELQRSDSNVPLHWNRGRRGRKFMGPKEREEVSARMKKYWAARRNGGANAEAGAEAVYTH
jgi:hypothetical protein